MADVMMKLGDYAFGIDTAAYQRLARSTSYRWAAQERVGAHDALQFTGPGDDTITLTGSIYPDWRGGTGQLERMREQAGKGKPLMMVDGNGFIRGRWVIESVEEASDTYAKAGVPRRQRFTLQLRRYDDGPTVSNP